MCSIQLHREVRLKFIVTDAMLPRLLKALQNSISLRNLRQAIFISASAFLVCACGGGSGTSVSAPVQSAADAAFQYGYPLTETMRGCDLYPNVNSLTYKSTLSTPNDTAVVRPNNDTLYASACVYLGASWVQISMPAANGRYMSLQVLDAYTNNVAVLDPNQIPAGGGQYVLHLNGSSSAGLPAGAPVIEVPTPFAYIICRTLVNGPADLAAANAAQNSITLAPDSTTSPSRPTVTGTTVAQDFFLKLRLRLAQNPPPASEASLVASFAAAGITPSLNPLLTNAIAEQQAAWETAYTQGLANLSAGIGYSGSVLNGWIFSPPDIGNPGTNYALRAVVARRGLFALPITAAFYPAAYVNQSGTTLNGLTSYTLHLPSTWPPVDPKGFWSLTMYDSNGFLVSNPINRYSISDRTPGIQFEADGSLNIYIQCTDPGGTRTANWLPAPCAPYDVHMRLYMPTATALDPGFTITALQ